jgi:hypothetical protein
MSKITFVKSVLSLVALALIPSSASALYRADYYYDGGGYGGGWWQPPTLTCGWDIAVGSQLYDPMNPRCGLLTVYYLDKSQIYVQSQGCGPLPYTNNVGATAQLSNLRKVGPAGVSTCPAVGSHWIDLEYTINYAYGTVGSCSTNYYGTSSTIIMYYSYGPWYGPRPYPVPTQSIAPILDAPVYGCRYQ